jgi:Ca2+-transporting ATPase
MSTNEDSIPAYQRSVNDTLVALATDLGKGLSAEQVRARLQQYGPNKLITEKAVPAWRKFIRQFQDVLVTLLLIATVISAVVWLYERDSALPYEAIAIFAIVLLNAIMGYVQTSRAEQAIASLRAMSPSETNVLRDGERRIILAAELVPGDVLLIEEGDTIPADGRLIQSTALQTTEAALTGESLPISKNTARIAGQSPLGDRHNMVFSGTVATYGRGIAVVVATGMQTEIGRIAKLLKETPSEITPLQAQLDRTGKLLGLIVITIAIAMIATIIVTEHVTGFPAIVDVLIFGVALAVAAVPEGLPTIVTVVLSAGIRRMARRNALIRHLACQRSSENVVFWTSAVRPATSSRRRRNHLSDHLLAYSVEVTAADQPIEGLRVRRCLDPTCNTLFNICASCDRANAIAVTVAGSECGNSNCGQPAVDTRPLP